MEISAFTGLLLLLPSSLNAQLNRHLPNNLTVHFLFTSQCTIWHRTVHAAQELVDVSRLSPCVAHLCDRKTTAGAFEEKKIY